LYSPRVFLLEPAQHLSSHLFQVAEVVLYAAFRR
jgi:hypothetical protein